MAKRNDKAFERRKAYMRYVRAFLTENDGILKKSGIYSVDLLVESQGNFKLFTNNIESLNKSFKSAFELATAPTPDTLELIHKAFGIDIGYGEFEYELSKNNSNFLPFLSDGDTEKEEKIRENSSDKPAVTYDENRRTQIPVSDTSPENVVPVSEANPVYKQDIKQPDGTRIDKKSGSATQPRKYTIFRLLLFLLVLVSLAAIAFFTTKKINLSNRDYSAEKALFSQERTIHGFNDSEFQLDCPTLNINPTGKPGNSGCGQKFIEVYEPQEIGLMFYLHNTSLDTAKNVRVKLRMLTNPTNDKTIFRGIVSINGKDSAVCCVYVQSKFEHKISISSDGDYYRDLSTNPDLITKTDNVLTNDGLKLPDIPRYIDCPRDENGGRNVFCFQCWLYIRCYILRK